MNQAYLQIKSLYLRLGSFSLRDINLSCNRREYHVLLGPTGSGKSSLMKCILGLHHMNSGAVFLEGRNISYYLPEHRRMGYVPQNYSLFPHLDVEKNIRFGLRIRRNPSEMNDALVNKLCETLNIVHLRNRKVQYLSGGEKQKVALARALAIKPDILLFDEPFSSIDEGAKRTLWMELKEIINEVGITVFHITHNLEEAYTMGERLSVLINGEMLQHGNKIDVFDRPANERVATYLNYRNIFEGISEESMGGTKISTDNFSLLVSNSLPSGKKVKFCIRQQDIKIIKEGSPVKDSLNRNLFSGEIVTLFPLPEYCLMNFRIDGSPQRYDFELRFPRYLIDRHDLYPGKKIRVAIWEPKIILFC